LPHPSVLIIDDEPALRKIVSRVFEQRGYAVMEADNGVDGLNSALDSKPDLIVLDLMMPGIHGFEVCKGIRANKVGYRPVIIVTSAKSYKPDIDKATEVGADAFLVKPTDLNELLRIADEHLGNRAGAQS
jgi:DNA-binding response OmpR family regulator